MVGGREKKFTVISIGDGNSLLSFSQESDSGIRLFYSIDNKLFKKINVNVVINWV